MQKRNSLTKQNLREISLADLTVRINEREKQIDLQCIAAVKHGVNAVQLAIEQGSDLMLARIKTEEAPRGRTKTKENSHGKGWAKWLLDNFPKSHDRARDYMRLAYSAKNAPARILENVKSLREAFRILGITPELESDTKQLPSITVSPITARLNFIAEWVVRESEEISKWEKFRRDELKIQLQPVVELFQKL